MRFTIVRYKRPFSDLSIFTVLFFSLLILQRCQLFPILSKASLALYISPLVYHSDLFQERCLNMPANA